MRVIPPFVDGIQQTGRPMQYGKAWYVNPELWGLKSSPRVNSAALDQEDDNAEGENLFPRQGNFFPRKCRADRKQMQH